MKLFLFVLLSSSLISTTALASGSTGGCTGTHQGKKIILNAVMNGEGKNFSNGTGSIVVDDRRVAVFEGSDLKVNYIFQSFKIENGQGDRAEGRMTNLIKKTGFLTRLYVPAFGIDFRNIPMTCWTN